MVNRYDPQSLDEITESSGPKSAFTKDSPIGSEVTGSILNAYRAQVRDYTSGKPAFWDDGNPKEQLVIVLQTFDTTDPDDNGERGVYVKIWNPHKGRLFDAVNAAGVSKLSEALRPGNVLTAKYVGQEPNPNPRMSPTKIYQYKIEVYNRELDDIKTSNTINNDTLTQTPTPTGENTNNQGTQSLPNSVSGGVDLGLQVRQLAASGIGVDDIARSTGLDVQVVRTLLAN